MPIDYKDYPPNWKTEIVPRILKRAHNKCEVCGLENGQQIHSLKLYLKSSRFGRYSYYQIWFSNFSDAQKVLHHAYESKVVKVVLTIAHLDHDSNNHQINDDRLKAMCQKCHLDYDFQQKYDKRTGKQCQLPMT